MASLIERRLRRQKVQNEGKGTVCGWTRAYYSKAALDGKPGRRARFLNARATRAVPLRLSGIPRCCNLRHNGGLWRGYERDRGIAGIVAATDCAGNAGDWLAHCVCAADPLFV